MPTLFFLVLLVFFLIHLLPGDPALAILGEHANAESLASLREQLGLNLPLWKQLSNFLLRLVTEFDLGNSIVSDESIKDQIVIKFAATFELATLSLIIASFLGILIGVLSAINRNSLFDLGSMFASLAGLSMPIFWLALLLIYVFSIQFQIFPVSGRVDPLLDFEPDSAFYFYSAIKQGNWVAFWSLLKHITLPSLALMTIPLAIITRFTRSTMLGVLRQDYIRTAFAKGLGKRRIYLKHALVNALIPILTIIGLQYGLLLGGAIITETIFSWPGLGSWLLEAVFARDYPAIQGATLAIGLSFIIINLLVDLSYIMIDPKLRKAS